MLFHQLAIPSTTGLVLKVKAKPDAEKHEKAHKETPEAEKSKSESSGDNDDSEV